MRSRLTPPGLVAPVRLVVLLSLALFAAGVAPGSSRAETPLPAFLSLTDTVYTAQLETGPVYPQGAALSLGPDPGSLFQYGGEGSAHLWVRDAAVAPFRIAVTTPYARMGSLAFWDPAGARLLLYGGVDSYGAGDDVMYQYRPGAPLTIVPQGPGAPLLGHFTSTYDGLHGRQVVLCGLRQADDRPGPTLWAFDDGTSRWSLVPTTGMPPLREGSRMAYDAAAGRFLVFGETFAGDDLRRVWSLDATTSAWAPLAVEGTSPVSARSIAVAWDPVGNALVVLSIDPASSAVAAARLDLAGTPRWSMLPLELPPGVDADLLRPGLPSSVHDARTNTLFVPTEVGVVSFAIGAALVGSIEGAAGTAVSRQGAYVAPLSAWWWHDGNAGIVHRRNAHGPYQEETFDIPAPGGIRRGAAVVFDTFRWRLIFYGGTVDGVPSQEVQELFLGDVRPSWETRTITGTPPPLAAGDPSAVFVRSGARLVVLENDLVDGLPVLASVDLAADEPSWIRERLARPLPERAVGWDAVPDENDWLVYLVGRVDPARPDEPRPVLRLDFRTYPIEWEELAAAPAHDRASLAFDVTRRSLLLSGGKFADEFVRDVWALTVYETGGWKRLEQARPPSPGQTHVGGLAGYDPWQDRLLVLGGVTCLDANDPRSCLASTGIVHRFLHRPEVQLLMTGVEVEEDRRVRVRMSGNLDLQVFVSRSEDDGATWHLVGEALQSGFGEYELLDQTAVAGRPYRYRGDVNTFGFELQTEPSETVVLPTSGHLLELRPYAGTIVRSGPLKLIAQVPPGAASVLELIDVRGRVLVRRSVAPASSEVVSLALELDPGPNAGPGLYFARLVQGSGSDVVKFIRL